MKKHYTFLFLLPAFLFCRINVTKAQVDVNDSLALVDLYNSTDGPHWHYHFNWLTSAPVSNWYGIYLTYIDNELRVTEIHLVGNSLKGTIPSSLGNLDKMQVLQLYSNQL